MSHIDPDQLALLALGSVAATPDDEEHLRQCAGCRDELRALRRAARAARATLDVGDLVQPSERVWHRIREEVAMPTRTTRRALRDEDTAPPARRTRRRRFGPRSGWAVAAAVAAVSVVGAGIWAWTTATAPEVIAEAELVALPDHPGVAGTARVQSAPGGAETLSIDVGGLTTATGSYREVWLLSGAEASPLSLGRLDGSSGTFAVPAGVDLLAYPIVDVSVEPDDGDPAHSGDSLTRGRLRLG